MMSDNEVRVPCDMLETPHENYCTLCGLPFNLYRDRHMYDLGGGYDPYWAWATHLDPHALELGNFQDDLVWGSYFLALRIPKGTTTGTGVEPNCDVSITGIGQYDQHVGRIPPPGYDIKNIRTDQKPVKLRRLLMNEDEKKEWENFEHFYSPKYSLDLGSIVLPTTQLTVNLRDASGNSIKSIYLMHPRCWDILLQQHALVASPIRTYLDLNDLSKIFLQIPLGPCGDRFRPDWVTDYAGPERFFWIDEMHDLAEERQWHFLARDPGMALGFDELLANPPLESAANISPRIQSANHEGDIFSRLPAEVLTEVLVLLPSASVRDLQLASRKTASVHLSSRYWRSRFDFPNDLCHVTLPPALLRSGQMGGLWVDWRRLCDQLLHPVGEEYGWWQNRKRITALNRKLAESMSLRRSDGRLKEEVYL